MPLGPNVHYRMKHTKGGGLTRLAFQGNNVVEAKNMQTGDTKLLPNAPDVQGQPDKAEYQGDAKDLQTANNTPANPITAAKKKTGLQRLAQGS